MIREIVFCIIIFVGLSQSENTNTSPFSSHLIPIRQNNSTVRLIRLNNLKNEENDTSPYDLDALLDIYNPHRLARIWDDVTFDNSTCYKNVAIFLKQLSAGRLWALQMSDASGRYNGGFFWGNDYWMGSSIQCENIKEPPFELGFFVMKAYLQFNKTLISNTHNQLIGLCLPLVCQSDEVEEILRLSVEEGKLHDHRTVNIVPVKSPHNTYNLSDDSMFWILILVTSFVTLMALGGTLLELYEEYNVERRKRSKYVYDNYTYQIAKTQHHQEVITGTVKIPIEPTTNDCGAWKDILLSFSVKRNMVTICDKSVGDDTIPTIHGLRSISMAWVILGHTCISALKYSDNHKYRNLVEKNIFFQTINNGAYAVDTFFFISGLLVSFLYFRTTAKHDMSKITRTTGIKSSLIEFIGMIAYRFARLTAPYIIMLGVVQVSMKWFHYNSVFETPTNDYVNCPQYWWRNILYINTLYPVQEMCMLWSWYLADDTQFYVLGAILLIMAVKNFKAAFTCLVIFLVSSWCTTAYIAYDNNHVPNEDDPLALFDKIYDKPWTRLGPYLVGMAVGWILFKTDCKIKMNKLTVVAGWIVSSCLLLFLVYGLYGSKLSPIAGAAFSSLSHTAWAAGLAWIVIACSTGYGGYITNILSASILYPFSRVTYCAYLVHPVVIRLFAMRMESPLHLGPDMVVVMFSGHLIMSYLISFIVSLLFEAPIVSLLRLVSPTKRKSKL